MKKVIAAQQVLSARTSDTGDGIRVALLDESGEEMVVILPLDQLELLSSWLDHARAMAGTEPVPARTGPTSAISVDRWTIRPEADEEHIILGFRLSKGGDIALRIHRSGAGAYAKALGSLLGRLLPASPSKARH